MPAQFDLATTLVTEFGIGLDDGKVERYVLVPVDSAIQSALREMVAATRNEMKKVAKDSVLYDPSEKHAGKENLHLALGDELAANVRTIHEANNLAIEPNALSNPSDVFCYFGRLSDREGRRLTAVRRATAFKGVLKARFVQLFSDALKLIQEKIFKLDRDFDLLVDDAGVHILRPAGFEFVGELQEAILKAAPTNLKAIKADLPFVDFGPIETYAAAHPRAARHLASIRAQHETKNIDQGRLKNACERTGVKVRTVQGKLVVDPSSIMDFLGVLDRRLYQVELVKGSPESSRAASRSKIVNVSGASSATP